MIPTQGPGTGRGNGEKRITVSQLRAGQSGKVVDVLGGAGVVNRLHALGIRPGKRITKVSAMFMRGPVTLRVDRAHIAIGFGMANKIVVEAD